MFQIKKLIRKLTAKTALCTAAAKSFINSASVLPSPSLIVLRI